MIMTQIITSTRNPEQNLERHLAKTLSYIAQKAIDGITTDYTENQKHVLAQTLSSENLFTLLINSYSSFVKEDAQITGFGLLGRNSEKCCELYSLYVLGQSRGKGSLILSDMINKSKRMGAESIKVESFNTRQALSFYAKHGFKATGRDVYNHNGVLIKCVHMNLDLSNLH